MDIENVVINVVIRHELLEMWWKNHGPLDGLTTYPMDPVVPSERKWDWGIIYYNLEG